ncbi:proteasome subunit alpha type-4-like [Scaptodrosophila lebanonensis]|uniref:Proteasome subunit alpha type-4-like n=1 Tax=Drosophila lebanonensis TaxID=7225 RepID=A0A6J2TSZ4_DROLE|nr:proteasome subunit alpha type-4-like [Scaptodrosophila lebanonensis]
MEFSYIVERSVEDANSIKIDNAYRFVAQSAMCVGIKAEDGVLLAAEREFVGSSVATAPHSTYSQKIFQINTNVVCALAGLSSDALALIKKAREMAQIYEEHVNEPMPCTSVATQLCNAKRTYIEAGGLHVFAVSILYMGWDARYGFQLRQSEPFGYHSECMATCVGKNSNVVISMLHEELAGKEKIMLDEAKDVLVKVLDKAAPDFKPENFEVATLQRVGGTTVYELFDVAEEEELVQQT